jgi:hypothetical protein
MEVILHSIALLLQEAGAAELEALLEVQTGLPGAPEAEPEQDRLPVVQGAQELQDKVMPEVTIKTLGDQLQEAAEEQVLEDRTAK